MGLRIRTKTTIIFLVLSLSPLAAIGMFAYQNGREAIATNLGASFALLAHETMDKVDRNLYEVDHNVRTWAELELMQEVITEDVDGKITSFLMGLYTQYGYYSSLLVLNRNGVVAASSNPILIGRNFTEKDVYKNSVRGETHTEDVHFDEEDRQWVVTFAVPIRAKFDPGRILGVLAAKWKASQLFALTKLGDTSLQPLNYIDLVLIRKDGLMISAPASQEQGIFTRNLLEEGFRSGLAANEKKGGYLIELDQRKNRLLIGFNHSKGYRDFPGLGWIALVVQDVQTAFAPIERLKLLLIGIGTGISCLVIITSVVLTQRMTGPILKISKLAQLVAQGDFEVRAEHASRDEIGYLAGIFNRMVQDLKKQRAQLVDKDYVDSILANMINSLIVIDSAAIIKKVNRASLDLLGYSEEELIDQPIQLILTEELPFKGARLEDLVKKGLMRNVETTYLSKDGKKIPVLFSWSMLHDSGNRIQGIICVAQDITQRKLAEDRLNYLANHDPLTGLPNRTLLIDRLNQLLTRSQWNKRSVAVLFLDLDHFKRINDTLGHEVGDLLLKKVAERLTPGLRGGDTVARIGGDEFVLILSDVATSDDIAKVCQKIIDALAKPVELESQQLFITASIGISVFPNDGQDAETLLKNADTAMYRAKDQGRNNYQHYSPAMNVRALERLALESSLHKALDQGEFQLNYQPQVDSMTERIVGIEALVRLQRADRSLVAPARFIPLAEETGLIVPIGKWVLRTACAQNKAWQAAGFPPLRVAVNISARQIQQRDLLDTVRETLKETGLDPRYLEMELTESIIQRTETIKILFELKDLGVQISIDDFGTGYYSLSYLKRLPINSLKIDQSFVREVTSDAEARAIVTAIVTLAHSLKLKVIAEAVETREQLEFLRTVECDEIQGYFFSKPLPGPELEELLTKGIIRTRAQPL